jgi:hypothetical protein
LAQVAGSFWEHPDGLAQAAGNFWEHPDGLAQVAGNHQDNFTVLKHFGG